MLLQPLREPNTSVLRAMLRLVLRKLLRRLLTVMLREVLRAMLRQMLTRCCHYCSPARCTSADFVMTKVVIPPDALNRFRHAASQFAGDVAPRASRLLVIKDHIAALRKRGISYRAIGELLKQNGIPASASGLMRFCRHVLNEKRSRHKSAKHRVARPASPASPLVVPANTTLPAVPASTSGTSPFPPNPAVSAPSKSRGPRIAKIELIKPK